MRPSTRERNVAELGVAFEDLLAVYGPYRGPHNQEGASNRGKSSTSTKITKTAVLTKLTPNGMWLNRVVAIFIFNIKKEWLDQRLRIGCAHLPSETLNV